MVMEKSAKIEKVVENLKSVNSDNDDCPDFFEVMFLCFQHKGV